MKIGKAVTAVRLSKINYYGNDTYKCTVGSGTRRRRGHTGDVRWIVSTLLEEDQFMEDG